jgi:hypothetical protein
MYVKAQIDTQDSISDASIDEESKVITKDKQ